MDNLFSEFLQVSLDTHDLLSSAPSAEWLSLYQEAQRQAVLGGMVDGLERLPKEQLPKQNLLLQWIGLAQMNEGTYHVYCERAKELTSRFEAARYGTCVLKGIGTAQLYPAPARRQCGDIDLWVSSMSDVRGKKSRNGCEGNAK